MPTRFSISSLQCTDDYLMVQPGLKISTVGVAQLIIRNMNIVQSAQLCSQLLVLELPQTFDA